MIGKEYQYDKINTSLLPNNNKNALTPGSYKDNSLQMYKSNNFMQKIEKNYQEDKD
jgi:hypothetical protein